MTVGVRFTGDRACGEPHARFMSGAHHAALDRSILDLWRTGRFDTLDIARKFRISEARAYAALARRPAGSVSA